MTNPTNSTPTATVTAPTPVRACALVAQAASRQLATAPLAQRNAALIAMAAELSEREDALLAANAADCAAARAQGTAEGLIDRLMLDAGRLAGCGQALADLAAAPDVLGEVVCGRTITDGIAMKQVRVPLGVVGMIYEARPNVTVEAAGIAIKTGNAMLLRGGSLAQRSNEALVDALRAGLVSVGLPAEGLQALDASNRDSARELMGLHGLVDVLIPRGGAGLIKSVVENAQVPVIETGTGNCHIYLHGAADTAMARAIVRNAKCQRPSVCNAAESLLCDASRAAELIPLLAADLAAAGVTLVCDDESYRLASTAAVPAAHLRHATEADWGTEYLDLTLSIHMVDSLEEAIAHINRYGTHHSDAIITGDFAAAQHFTAQVDSAAVYVNASTRFTDGAMFGLGAEIGISTQKLHARGPMGLAALTSTKFILEGSGQVRQ